MHEPWKTGLRFIFLNVYFGVISWEPCVLTDYCALPQLEYV